MCAVGFFPKPQTSPKHYLIYLQNIFAEEEDEKATSTVTSEIQKHRADNMTYPGSSKSVCHYKH